MKRVFSLAIAILFLFIWQNFISFQPQISATTIPKQMLQAAENLKSSEQIDFSKHFQDLGIEGAIAIYDSNNDSTYQHNPQRNQTPFLPASTFKILNSLIALENQVIANEIAILTWDGIEREIPQWNRDLNMTEAFKLSAVWFYQVLARRVGYQRMQQWVAKAGYGNQNIGRAEEIDRFWLEGELRITPQEQIQFLRRFYNNELPFSQRSLSIVKDIMIVEQTPDYTLRGKSGWVGFGTNTTPQIGWYVGYLEQADNVYFFSTNINNDKDSAARMKLIRLCFKDLRLL